MGSYGIRTITPASGVGLLPLYVETPQQRIVKAISANQYSGLSTAVAQASNLALVAAVGGVGLLAYLAAKALKK